ncbi:hypothetical protein AFB00_16080 [Pseudonocardia sp. HH130630-07]|nr:hypothetical protein [Pseudonocardia sp. HH130630-07]ANY07559.1 hypothetical protein AFB00_16080 [Pseudonocardia sp. HH130630-07]
MSAPAGWSRKPSNPTGGVPATAKPSATRPASGGGSGCANVDDVIPARSSTDSRTYCSKGRPVTRSTTYPASEYP